MGEHTMSKKRHRPSAIKSVFAELPCFNTGDTQLNLDRATQAAGEIVTARESAAKYREAVLANPEASAALAGALAMEDASAWNGYVPPRESDATLNDSPVRARAAAIVTETLRQSGELTYNDNERLAPVPERFIRAPWQQSGHPDYPGTTSARDVIGDAVGGE